MDEAGEGACVILPLARLVGAGRRRGGLLVGFGRLAPELRPPGASAAAADHDAPRRCWCWSRRRAAQVDRYWGSRSHGAGSVQGVTVPEA